MAWPLIVGVAEPHWHLLLATGPALAGVVVTALASGVDGLRSLGRRITNLRLFPSWRWWFISTSPIGYLGLVLLTLRLAGQLPDTRWDTAFDGEGWMIGLVGASLSFGLFEEIGWRGVLLPRLLAGRSAATASLMVWLIWAGWHAPMFLYHFDYSLVMTAGWLVGLYFGTVFLTVLHNSTRGSLLAVVLFHFSMDFASILSAAIGDLAPAVISVGVILATVIAARWGGSEDLSRYGRYVIADARPRLLVPSGK
jgi:membrane protease YdiL (CAAX protease family)